LAVLQRLRIEAALRSGDVADAQARAQRLVKQQPKAAVSHMLLGQVALARHEPAEAIQAFAQAHRLEPSTESLLRLYAAQVGQVDPARNLGLLQQWLAQRPDDALVRNALAESLVALGRLADARRHYELLLKQTDANAVRNNLADVLLRLKDPGALALAKEALRREPANPTILDTAGWAHVQAGQAEQALPLLRDALARDPAAAGTRYHLAQALATLGRRDEALQALRTALADNQAAFDRPAALTLLRSLETGH
ncbi:tetratricopeptide repeat protein, partial [Roseateles sp.]|uniref:tetratricopeptide repeat protein n=1 Tax=Roseateles sp. TaxID=1971397 RepID=UPI002E040719|nr:tetratricopeptide repeat protein [Roseateles sp.]